MNRKHLRRATHSGVTASTRSGGSTRWAPSSPVVRRAVLIDRNIEGLGDSFGDSIAESDLPTFHRADGGRADPRLSSQFRLGQRSKNSPIPRESILFRNSDDVGHRTAALGNQASEQIDLRRHLASFPVSQRPSSYVSYPGRVSDRPALPLTQLDQLVRVEPAQDTPAHSLSLCRAAAMSRHCAATSLVSSSKSGLES